MKKIETVNIIGMGALGLLFGEPIRQHRAEQPRYVMDPARLRRHAGETYTINGRTIAPVMITPDMTGPADLVLVGVKYPGLPAALDTMASSVGPDTVILSLMNGVDSEERIAARYGPEKVLYSVSQEMDAQRYGSDLVYTRAGQLYVGVPKTADEALRRVLTEKLDRVCAFFDDVGLPHTREEDIIYRQWSKFMLNVGCNQICMVYDCGYGPAMVRGSEAFAMMTGAMREVCAIAAALDIPVGEREVKQYLDILRTLDPAALPSMGQDRRQRVRSEVDMFAGVVIAWGERLGIETPVNDYMLRRVREIEAAY